MPLIMPMPYGGGGHRSYRRKYKTRKPKDYKKIKRQLKNWNEFKKRILKDHPRTTKGSLEHFGADWKSATEMQKLSRKAFGYKGAGDYSSLFRSGLNLASKFLPGNFLYRSRWEPI